MLPFCWHKWSKWSRPIVVYNAHKQQWRSCIKCEKAQFRTLGYDKFADVKEVNKSLDEIAAAIDRLKEEV
jgi:hypothetical protein